MRKLSLVIPLISALVCTGPVQAGLPGETHTAPTKKKIYCPEHLDTRQRLVRPVEGWDVYIGASGAVSWTDFYTDDPIYGARIKDDSMVRPIVRPNGEALLQVAATAPSQLKNEGWILCSYEDTRIDIARPTGLPDDRCGSLYGRKNKYGGTPIIGADCE